MSDKEKKSEVIWDIGEYFLFYDLDKMIREYGITSDTSDKELADIEEQIVERAWKDDVGLVNVYRDLHDIRNSMRQLALKG